MTKRIKLIKITSMVALLSAPFFSTTSAKECHYKFEYALDKNSGVATAVYDLETHKGKITGLNTELDMGAGNEFTAWEEIPFFTYLPNEEITEITSPESLLSKVTPFQPKTCKEAMPSARYSNAHWIAEGSNGNGKHDIQSLLFKEFFYPEFKDQGEVAYDTYIAMLATNGVFISGVWYTFEIVDSAKE